jgi:dTDP-4-amino-4,6-dideoxygalactose transaminase
MAQEPDSETGDRSDESLAITGGPKAVTVDNSDIFDWPIITQEDEEAAINVLRDGEMSGTEITKKFEEEYAVWQETEYALGHSSGTEAIIAAMYAVNVGSGDEVIGPSLTYWAAILPCLGLGATPVFADIERDTLCIDPESFKDRISEHTQAVVVVHNCGHPAKMDRITEIAQQHDIAVIEDVSHAHGGCYHDRRLGNWGDVGVMSLMSKKPLAAGEAGMLVTDKRDIYERAVAFGHYERHDSVLEIPKLKEYAGLPFGGYKHRMHQISSAVGRVQLKRYDERMAEIQKAMNYFWDQLSDTPGISAHRIDDDAGTMGGWYKPMGLYNSEELGGLPIEQFAEAVRAEGSECDPGCYFPLHEHPLLNEADIYRHGEPTRIANARRDVRDDSRNLSVAENIHKYCFDIPWFKRYQPDIIEQHANAFKKVTAHHEELLEMSS